MGKIDLFGGIGFGEAEIYSWGKEYLFAKAIVFDECRKEWINGKFEQT